MIPARQQNFNEPVTFHRKQNVPGEDYVPFHTVAVPPSIDHVWVLRDER